MFSAPPDRWPGANIDIYDDQTDHENVEGNNEDGLEQQEDDDRSDADMISEGWALDDEFEGLMSPEHFTSPGERIAFAYCK